MLFQCPEFLETFRSDHFLLLLYLSFSSSYVLFLPLNLSEGVTQNSMFIFTWLSGFFSPLLKGEISSIFRRILGSGHLFFTLNDLGDLFHWLIIEVILNWDIRFWLFSRWFIMNCLRLLPIMVSVRLRRLFMRGSRFGFSGRFSFRRFSGWRVLSLSRGGVVSFIIVFRMLLLSSRFRVMPLQSLRFWLIGVIEHSWHRLIARGWSSARELLEVWHNGMSFIFLSWHLMKAKIVCMRSISFPLSLRIGFKLSPRHINLNLSHLTYASL